MEKVKIVDCFVEKSKISVVDHRVDDALEELARRMNRAADLHGFRPDDEIQLKQFPSNDGTCEFNLTQGIVRELYKLQIPDSMTEDGYREIWLEPTGYVDFLLGRDLLT